MTVYGVELQAYSGYRRKCSTFCCNNKMPFTDDTVNLW